MTQQNIATMQDILDALEQNPDLQREFHKHVVDVIRNDDAIRQDLRKEILTEELLLLPARFTRIEEDVDDVLVELPLQGGVLFQRVEDALHGGDVLLGHGGRLV